MLYMADELRYLVEYNKMLYMPTVGISNIFNHCSDILYYVGKNLKEKSTLGFHSDCVYSPINDELVTESNSLMDNTPVVVYLLSDSCNLHWKQRNI